MFQKLVINSIKQDESKVAIRWAEFQKFLVKVEKIKGFKEEEYQERFLEDIFVNCLGFTLKKVNPSNFNLEREKKNETGIVLYKLYNLTDDEIKIVEGLSL